MNPITVSATPMPEQLASTLRAFLIALGAYLAGKGWIDAGLASAAVPLVLVLGPWIWNQFKIRSTNAKMQVLANAVPDRIGSVE